MHSTPLHSAVDHFPFEERNNFSLVERHLKNGENVNARDEHDRNVLEVAVLRDQPRDIIQLLLDLGADISGGRGPHGNAFVHAVGGSLDIMGLLLDRAAAQNGYSPRFASRLRKETYKLSSFS